MPSKFDTNVEWVEKFFPVIGNKFSSMTLHSGKTFGSMCLQGKKFGPMFSSLCCSTQEMPGMKFRHMICTLELLKFFISSLCYFPPRAVLFNVLLYSSSIHCVVLIIVLTSCCALVLFSSMFYSFHCKFPIILHCILPFSESTSNLISFPLKFIGELLKFSEK